MLLTTVSTIAYGAIAWRFLRSPSTPPRAVWITFRVTALAMILFMVVDALLVLKLYASLRQRFGHLVIASFVCAAIPEESFKALLFVRLIKRGVFGLRGRDWIFGGVLIGLAFGGLESLGYAFMQHSLAEAAQRAAISVPGHAAYTGLCAAIVASGAARPKLRILVGLVLATTLHGVYDLSGLSIQLFDASTRPTATIVLRVVQGAITFASIVALWLIAKSVPQRDDGLPFAERLKPAAA